VPLTRQSTNWTCGVAALQSVLRYFSVDDIREDNLTKELLAGPAHGTRYFDIMRVAKLRGLTIDERREKTLDDLKRDIDSGKPVLVCYQAWVEEVDEGDSWDWEERWDDGHYSVVVGYDSERFFLMDPSTLGCYAYIPFPEFEARWHDIDGVDDEIRLIHWGLSFTKQDRKEESLHVTASYLG